MRRIAFSRTGWLGLALCATLLAGCGDTNSDVSAPAPAGVLALACPGSVTAGVKTAGFTATLIQPGGTPVGGALINITPVPNQGSVYAPAGSTTATSGGTTDAQGQLGFGFTVPSGTASGTVFQLVASSGGQSKSCQVTVQTPSLVFAAPATGSTQSVCTPVRLSALSSAGSNPVTPIASTVDVSTTGNGLLTTNAQACTGSATLNGLRLSGTTGDFEVPLYVVARAASATTVTLTDSNDATRTASINLNFVEQPTALSLNVDTQQVNPAPASSRFATLTATVTSASGRTVASQPVAFSLTAPVGGSPVDQVTPAVAATDGSGAAVARYEAGSKTGQATVRACVQNTQICDTRTVTVTTASTTPPAATPNRLTLDASPLQVSASPADARFSTLTATVYDASNGVLANQAVAFTLTKSVGGINTDRLNPPNSTTGSAGTTTSRYEAGSNAGYATIQACVQGTQVCDTRSITVTASSGSGSGSTTPTPSKLTLSATPQSVTTAAGTAPYSNLKAMVYDAANNGLSGQGVTFTVQLSGGGSGSVDQASATTDTNGAATSRFTAGTTAGSATVKACVQGTGICDAQTITVTAGTTTTSGQVARLDFTGTTTVAAQPSTQATATTLTATPRDANNQPLAGLVVSFTLQAAGGGDQVSPTQATTSSSGTAQTMYQAGTATGTATVTACVPAGTAGAGNVCQSVNITVSNGGTTTGTVPAGIKVTASVATVKQYPSTGDTSVVTARVTDSSGNAVPNQTVGFNFQNSTGGSTPDRFIAGGSGSAQPNGTGSTASGQTDANGNVTVTYQAGGNGGSTAIIQACNNSICSGSASSPNATITTVRPTKVVLGPAGGSVAAGSATTLTATVSNDAGDVTFDNQTLVFGFYANPNNQGTLSASQATANADGSIAVATNASGQGIVTFRAGTGSGTYTIYVKNTDNGYNAQQNYTVP